MIIVFIFICMGLPHRAVKPRIEAIMRSTSDGTFFYSHFFSHRYTCLHTWIYAYVYMCIYIRTSQVNIIWVSLYILMSFFSFYHVIVNFVIIETDADDSDVEDLTDSMQAFW
jgi:hypothetical protein